MAMPHGKICVRVFGNVWVYSGAAAGADNLTSFDPSDLTTLASNVRPFVPTSTKLY